MIQQINHLNLEQEIGLKINDRSGRTYNANSDTKFKASMIGSYFCDYSDFIFQL